MGRGKKGRAQDTQYEVKKKEGQQAQHPFTQDLPPVTYFYSSELEACAGAGTEGNSEGEQSHFLAVFRALNNNFKSKTQEVVAFVGVCLQKCQSLERLSSTPASLIHTRHTLLLP